MGRNDGGLGVHRRWGVLPDLVASQTEALQHHRHGVGPAPLRFTATNLWLFGVRDDLVLHAETPRDLTLTDNAQ